MKRILCMLLAIAGTAAVARPKVIFVLDLDETMIFNDVRGWSPMERFRARDWVLRGDRGIYRTAHGLGEFVRSFDRFGIAVEFVGWSAYERDDRNAEICRQVFSGGPLTECSALSAMLRSKDIVSVKSSAPLEYWRVQPPWAVFEGELKKDLRKVPGVEADTVVVLIDNAATNAFAGQEKHLLWVRNRTVEGEMARVRGILGLAMEWHREHHFPLTEALWRIQWEKRADGTLRYRSELAEGPEVYLRGIAAFQEVNPRFDVGAAALAPMRPALVPEDGPRPPELFPVMTPRTSVRLAKDTRLIALAEFFSPMRPAASTPALAPPFPVPVPLPLSLGETFYIDSTWYRVTDHWNATDDIAEYLVVPVETPTQPSSLRIARTAEGISILKSLAGSGLRRLAGAGVVVPRVHRAGDGYLLQDLLTGISAKEWLAQRPPNVLMKAALERLIRGIAASGLYVAGLRPEDVLWNGTEWTLQRSARVHTDFASADLLPRFHAKLLERWRIALDILPPPPPPPPPLAQLLPAPRVEDCGDAIVTAPTAVTVPLPLPAAVPPVAAQPPKRKKDKEGGRP